MASAEGLTPTHQSGFADHTDRRNNEDRSGFFNGRIVTLITDACIAIGGAIRECGKRIQSFFIRCCSACSSCLFSESARDSESDSFDVEVVANTLSFQSDLNSIGVVASMRPSHMPTDELLQAVADQLEIYEERAPIWNEFLATEPPSDVDESKHSSSISVYSTATQSPESEEDINGDEVEDVTVPDNVGDTGNFPKSYWREVDFEKSELMVRSIGYDPGWIIPGRKEKAMSAICHTLAVDLFVSEVADGEKVCICQCPNSFAYRKLSSPDTSKLFVVHFMLPDLSMGMYFEQPEVIPDTSCGRLFNKLLNSFSMSDGETFRKKRLKIIPFMKEGVPLPPGFGSVRKKPAILESIAKNNVVCFEGERYFEVCIDFRQSSSVNKVFQGIKGLSTRFVMDFGITVQPDQDTKAGELPEGLVCALSITNPDISAVTEKLQVQE